MAARIYVLIIYDVRYIYMYISICVCPTKLEGSSKDPSPEKSALVSFNVFHLPSSSLIHHLLKRAQQMRASQIHESCLISLFTSGLINISMVSSTSQWSHQHLNGLINISMVSSTSQWSHQHLNGLINISMVSSTSQWSHQHLNGLINISMVSSTSLISLKSL